MERPAASLQSLENQKEVFNKNRKYKCEKEHCIGSRSQCRTEKGQFGPVTAFLQQGWPPHRLPSSPKRGSSSGGE